MDVVAEVGGAVDEFSVTLAIYGDDLDPADVSAVCGLEPSDAHRRADRKNPQAVPYSCGGWFLTHLASAPASVSDEPVVFDLYSYGDSDEL